MADSNEIPVVEVEDFVPPEVIDENDVMYGDDGKVESYIDREKNQRFVKKAAVEKPATNAVIGDEAPAGEPKKPNAGDGDNKGDQEEEEEIIDNAAEYILRKSGYDKEEINLGGEGDQANLVKIKDLTPEQQMDVVVSEFDRTIEQYESRIKELETKAPELKFENPLHQQIVDFLKEGGDVQKLAKQILSNDPAAQARMMSDSEIVKMGIKKEYAEFTDEEVDAELKDMSADKIARRAKALRARMEKENPNIDNLTSEQKQANDATRQKAREVHDTEVKSVRDYLSKAKDIAGIPVNEEMKSFLATRVIPDSPDAESEFMQKLDTPEKLIRLEFLDRYFEQIRKRDQDHFYKKGISDAQTMKADELQKYSREPLRTYNLTQGKDKGKVIKTVDDVEDWDKFASTAPF